MGQSCIFSMNNGIRFSNGTMISFTFGRVQGAKWDIVVKFVIAESPSWSDKSKVWISFLVVPCWTGNNHTIQNL